MWIIMYAQIRDKKDLVIFAFIKKLNLKVRVDLNLKSVLELKTILK